MKIVSLDKVFKKLLTVVPQGLSRETTRTYLNDYQFRELEADKGIITDFYVRPNTVPIQSMQVIFKGDHPYFSLIALVYPLGISRFIERIHRRGQFRKLCRILTKQYGKPIERDGLFSWTKDNIQLTSTMSDNGKEGRLSVDTKIYDTNIVPVDGLSIAKNYLD